MNFIGLKTRLPSVSRLVLASCALGVLAAASAEAAWTPPLGIPAPSFGVNEVAGATTVTVQGSGSIPNPVPAGAVVLIQGTYSKDQTGGNRIQCAGTAQNPAFIRGAAGAVVTGSWEISGSYCIVENLKFGPGGFWTVLGPADHIAVRDSEFVGDLSGAGGLWVSAWTAGGSASNIVFLRNNVHHSGDWQATYDQDAHGTGLYRSSSLKGTSTTISNVWILDSQYSYNSGDGVQVNANDSGDKIHHIYIGRNVAHHNKQTGFWLKNSSDVVVSENKSYTHRPSDSSSGYGLGFQYDPYRVWFLFNESYDNTVGIGTGSPDSSRRDAWFIGNVLHDNLESGFELNGWVAGEYVIGNTFHNNPIGLDNGYYKVGVEISDNVFSASSTAHISFREYGAGSASNLRNSLFSTPVKIVWDDVTKDVAGMQGIGECQGCRTGDPLFVNAAGGDFNLKSGSPAIDGGAVEAAYATFQQLYGIDIRKDKAGRTRPQGAAWDIGAYEFASGATTTQLLTVVRAGDGGGTVTSSPAGIACGSDCSEAFNTGTVVALTAAPSSGSSFTGWSGACTGTGACSVTLDAAKTVTATFTLTTLPTYALSVGKAGTGTGTVTSSPAGISCGSTCSAGYSSGTVVSLTATPAAGSSFAGWTGACTGTSACSVTLDAAKSVSATFTLNTVQSYTLTVGKAGTGSGTVASTPAGIACGATCSAGFASGTVVGLTATAASGSSFAGWGGACAGTAGCSVTMSAARSVTATFNPVSGTNTLTVTKSGDGTGTVTSTPAGVSCGATCSYGYASGTVVSLSASPDSGSVFLGWGGACSGTGACSVTTSGAATVTASFGLAMERLTATTTLAGTLASPAGPGSGGTVTSTPAGISCGSDCTELYSRGTSVALTATAASGYTFSGWSGDCSGTAPTCKVSMTAVRNVGATFRSGNAPPPVGDFDRDGWVDLLWTNKTTGALYTWFLKNGTMTSGAYFTPSGLSDTSWQVEALGDLDGDGDTDLLWRNRRTGALGTWLMDGTTQARSVALPAVRFPWGSASDWEVRGLADFNGDRKSDIVWRNVSGAQMYVTFMNGTTPVSSTLTWPQRPSSSDTSWQIGALADLNGDGKTDVVWNNRTTGALKVWYMNGTTGTSYGTTAPSATGDPNLRLLGAADYDNDGKADLFFENRTTQEMRVWLMSGATRTSLLPLSPGKPTGADWKIVPR
jgi:uncharacterized repeat protein (TIGR02543 family)